jgi:hypothetical protein
MPSLAFVAGRGGVEPHGSAYLSYHYFPDQGIHLFRVVFPINPPADMLENPDHSLGLHHLPTEVFPVVRFDLLAIEIQHLDFTAGYDVYLSHGYIRKWRPHRAMGPSNPMNKKHYESGALETFWYGQW